MLGLLFVVTMCGKDADDCLTNAPNPTVVCIEIYAPVCGCNNITYSNDCYAGSSGISSWTEGACKTN